MKAFFIQAVDGKAVLEKRDIPEPKAGPGQVLIKVKAAGLNRGELIVGGLIKAGAPKPAGQEAAGEVVGSGERVMGRCPGAFAEYALIDAREAIPVPPNLSWEEAASVPLTFMVVHDMLVEQGNLQKGEWVLVTGISSGVGVAALQAAHALDARVIGTSGSSKKLEALKQHGLDVAIETRKADFSRIVLEATGAKGANLCVNTVGGSVFAECVKSLGYEGRLAIVGYVDKVLKGEFDLEAVHSKRLRIFGVSNKLRTPEQRAGTVAGFRQDFLPLFAGGRIKPLVDKVFPLGELEAAKAYMESDRQTGKIVVKV